MRTGQFISGSRSFSPRFSAWVLGVVLLLVGIAPAAALEAAGQVDAGGFTLKASYATPRATSVWAVEVRGEGRVWPGLLLGPQGQVWARLPGLAVQPSPRLALRHPASKQQAQVSGARKVALASGNGDWWLLESDARAWVEQTPPGVTPGPGQPLWAYTFSARRDRLVRNAYPARVSGDRLGLAGAQTPSLGLVTDQSDRVVGLLAGPGEVTSLAQAQEALAVAAALSIPNPPAVTPISSDGASTTSTTTLPPSANPREPKEKRGMPEYVCVILGFFATPLAAWVMGFMVFRATWGKMSPYRGVAIGMAVFWLLMAIAEYWIWVGTREPREALLQLTLSVGLPSLFSWTVILSNIFRRLRD